MDKEASNLLRMALLGLLAGGGTYGGLRLARDVQNAATPKPQDPNQLELTLPASRFPKVGNEIDRSPLDWLGPAASGLAGFGGGFLGAGSLYEAYRKKELAKQQKLVQDNYMAALQQAHGKAASVKTPLVDKFLSSIITKVGEMIDKEAWENNLPYEDYSNLLGSQALRGAKAFAGTGPGNLLLSGWLGTLLGSGALTYGIARKVDKQKQQNEQKTTSPTEVKLKFAD